MGSVDRGWYLEGSVGSGFCSCKMLMPNPKPYVFQAQAKSRPATKVVSSAYIRLVQNLCISLGFFKIVLKRTDWMFVVILRKSHSTPQGESQVVIFW